jgi:ATP-dependent helicase/DNAse subunit B
LKEKDEVAEDVDASQFGKLLHHVMYLLYKPFETESVQKEDIKQIAESGKIETSIHEAFEMLYPSRGSQTWKLSGKNLIVKEIIQKYISKILEVDEIHAPFEIIAVEKWIERKIEIPSVDFPVTIGGYVDRIDYKEGTYRIIDYKTGDANPGFKDIEGLFQGEKRKQKDSALQCLIYAYILMEAFPEGAIQAGLYSVRKMFDKNFDYTLKFYKGETISDIGIYKEEIYNQLKDALTRLLDPALPFTKTNDLKACINCAFRNICHR